MQYLQASLKFSGIAPVDKRGKHNNRPNRLQSDILNYIKEHLKYFKGRSSHYSNKKTAKIYLPEAFDIKKMYTLFLEKYPQHKLSYEAYRAEFKKYNISFGYPRSDTCSTCDRINAELKSLAKQESTPEIKQKCKQLETEKKLHLAKAGVFYERKRNKKIKARNDREFEAIAVDYQKNVSLPNITTNDVYYRRQLSMYTFNIHVLSTGQSYFYCYPETTAKKGSNEVMSFLHHFIINYLDKRVKQLSIFCDSCGGQNKYYNLIKWLHFITNQSNLLNRVDITFPIRGHSYLECDKNFGIIKLKTKMEVPCDFYELIANARAKPSPFQVINVEEDPRIVRDWADFLKDPMYKKTCPFKIQEIRELYCSSQQSYICHRSNYNGLYSKGIIIAAKKKGQPQCTQVTRSLCQGEEFYLPNAAYEGINLSYYLSCIILIKNNLFDIKYCFHDCFRTYTNIKRKVQRSPSSEEAQVLFTNLPHLT